MTDPQPSAACPPSQSRRHDLDAVRSLAMLLGIALHAALAYTGVGWIVSDGQHSSTLSLLVAATHGFRMPLFFLLSGFFTAMLWKQRGLRGMLNHRGKRLLLPLVLGCVTILPAMLGTSFWAISRQAQSVHLPTTTNIWSAAAAGDIELLGSLAKDPALLNAQDPTYGVTPLGWTVITDHHDAAKALLALGADPNGRNRDSSTPLHNACFFGRTDVARTLLANGADPDLTIPSGERPRAALQASRESTEFIANILRV
ncbi:MAG: acyltransferase family protein, partial [Phycisphaerales bacterium]